LKIFYIIITAFLFVAFLPVKGISQACNLLTAVYESAESRCAATGSIKVNAAGGSGNYQYKVTGPVTTNYTSSSLIVGLAAGKYLVFVKDIVTNCLYAQDSVTVTGSYVAPSFTLVSTAVSCPNGNDGTITVTGTSNGRSPFSYKIAAPSASGIGTVSAFGTFSGLLSGNYLIQLTDSCGAIQTRSIVVNNFLWFINNYSVTKLGCDSIAVVISLKDDRGNITPHAVFNGFTYGVSAIPGDTSWFSANSFQYYKGKKHTVKLFAKDACGNIQMVVWSDNAIPGVNSTINISNKACSTFTAKVRGQANLTNPNYCIYNSSNVLMSCNTTGVFTGLLYGSYCIKIADTCYDTTITRCFSVARPVPEVDMNVNIARTCNSFTATITGQVNLSNPNYCLYDAGNVLILCNTTGVFPDLPFGTYCIKVVNDPACYDTVINRCFAVSKPVPRLGVDVSIYNKTCTTFTAQITDTADWSSPQFCLYTPAHVVIICNTTGVFNDLPYGTYCIEAKNGPGCYDTTISRCFTVTRPTPVIDDYAVTGNRTCTTFDAAISGQTNVSNPQYCLYNESNVLLGCNATGVFTAIPYGSYCIKMQNDAACYDTVITRCFTEAGTPVSISLSARKSCTVIGTTDIRVKFNSGTPVYTVALYSPTGVLLQTASTAASPYTFFSLPGLVSPAKYKVIVTDFCGRKDSGLVSSNVSRVNRVVSITAKCPSAVWANGSADVVIDINDNNIGGNIIPKIIRKNEMVVSVNAASSVGYSYTFSDLGPATYIFDTYINDCNKHVFDTVVVKAYQFPGLTSSKAFQCDNQSYTVTASVTGGRAPYMYEIFGSVPAAPSIVTAPQASPVFSINNGASYSLIRLRVVDACGNASLYDANVLPLSNFLVFTDSLECFNHSLTLRVDSIANATYNWYKRIVPNDSIFVGTGPSYYVSNLTPSDTGRYFCIISINNGCVTKFANYKVSGWCGNVLPVPVTLHGEKMDNANRLYWHADNASSNKYHLQRSANSLAGFETITVVDNAGNGEIFYKDINPPVYDSYYRLKIVGKDGGVDYSNLVLLKKSVTGISIYPNPINNVLYISVNSPQSQSFSVSISNLAGQKLFDKFYTDIQDAVLTIPRKNGIVSGMYLLTITFLRSNEKQVFKLVYR
jgi:Secretion system C-terminal sorting domain/SprB repeat